MNDNKFEALERLCTSSHPVGQKNTEYPFMIE